MHGCLPDLTRRHRRSCWLPTSLPMRAGSMRPGVGAGHRGRPGTPRTAAFRAGYGPNPRPRRAGARRLEVRAPRVAGQAPEASGTWEGATRRGAPPDGELSRVVQKATVDASGGSASGPSRPPFRRTPLHGSGTQRRMPTRVLRRARSATARRKLPDDAGPRSQSRKQGGCLRKTLGAGVFLPYIALADGFGPSINHEYGNTHTWRRKRKKQSRRLHRRRPL